MADDPTTTGAPKADGTEGGTLNMQDATGLLRAIPGARVSEQLHFTFTWKGELIFDVADGGLVIILEIKDKDSETVFQRLEWPPIPLRDFGSPANLNTFLAALKRNFIELLRQVLAAETVEHLLDVSEYLAGMMGFTVSDQETIVRRHTEATSKRVRNLLKGLPERQKPGAWSKIALRNAVAMAAFRLTQRNVIGRALTLDAVRDELAAEYGEQAPQSGEALRKQLEERGLNWRPIKREVERYAETEAERHVAPPFETGG